MKIAVIGNGGHSKVIKDIIEDQGYELTAVLDDKLGELKYINNCYYGSISSATELINRERNIYFIVAIGSNVIRKEIVFSLGLSDENFINIIHSSAVISKNVEFGAGIVVMPNVVINADSIIGNHAIINTGAVIEHDNRIGNYVHISPNATLTGNVTIGEGTQIGAGATIIPGKIVGDWSIVGAGSTVIQNIPSNSVAVGSPARLVKRVNKE